MSGARKDVRHKKSLREELQRLLEISKNGDFEASLDIDAMSQEEQSVACSLSQILNNYQAIIENDTKRYALSKAALKLTRWDMEIESAEHFDIQSLTLQELERYVRFFGEEDFSGTLSGWLTSLHPQDKQRAFEALRDHLGDSTGKTPYDLEYRIMTKEGNYRHVRAFCTTIRDETGRPLHTLGMLKDVDQQVQMKKTFAEDIAQRDKDMASQAYWYRSILDSISLPLSVTDTDMNLTFANRRAVELFGKDRKEVLGRHCSCQGVPLCGSDQCALERAKKGLYQTFFNWNDSSYQVNTSILHNQAGGVSGYLEIFNDITEVESNARQDADAANEAKTLFLAVMSHEMRTPLNVILGFSKLLFLRGDLHQEAVATLDKIHNAASTLLNIINDILDISKIEAGKYEILQSEYDMKSLISDVISQNILWMQDKPIRFEVDANENIPAILGGDELRIKQILGNLLSNAFKYTEQGLVKLSLDHRRDDKVTWMTFRVCDTGIGMKPEELEQLFSTYTRFTQPLNREKEGTGLGLSIAKRLVDLMDGTIEVESEFGKGSTFTVKLPQQYLDDSVIGREASEQLRQLHCSSEEKLRHSLRLNRVQIPYARVLVVDDNPANLEIARGFMKPYGMSVDCATSGQAAIDALRMREVEYNAIFMDHMMPDMDGVETTHFIRNKLGESYLKTVPVIALTANAFVGSKEWFIDQGFNDFLSKPIDMFELDEIIQRWLRDREREKSLWASRELIQNQQGKSTCLETGNEDADLQFFAKTIEGLDWASGLRRFGSEEALCRILRSYIVHTRPLLDSLSEVTKQSLAQYAITIHGIKGASRGISAERLGDLAESLEWAAKAGDFDFIVLNNPTFLKTAHALIEEIDGLLALYSKP